MGKGRFATLRDHWAKSLAGIFVLALGVFSLNSVDESILQANLLAGNPTSAQPSANVEIYDLAEQMDIVHSGELVPMLAVDFTATGGSLSTVGITIVPDQASLFTDSGTTSEIFAETGAAGRSSYTSFVVIKDDGDDIWTTEDEILPSSAAMNWSVSGNNGSLTWNAPETLSITSGDTFFLAMQVNDEGFKPTHNGLRFSMRLDSLSGFSGADNLSAVTSSNMFLDTFRPRLKRMIFSGAPANGTTVDLVFDQTMNPGGNVSSQLVNLVKDGGSAGSFGSGATFALNTSVISNDTLRATMTGSHDLEGVENIYFNITNEHGQTPDPVFISFDPPELIDVFVDDDDGDNKFESAGDMMYLFFDTPMDRSSCNFTNPTNCFTLSQGSIHSSNSYIYWPADDMAVIRLTADNTGQDPVGGTIKPTTNLQGILGNAVDSGHETLTITAPNSQFPRAEEIYIDFVDNPSEPVINENTMGTLHWKYDPNDVAQIQGMEILLLPAEYAGTKDIDSDGALYTAVNNPGSLDTASYITNGVATFNFATYATQIQQNNSGFFMGYDSLTTYDEEGELDNVSYVEPNKDYRFHILTCDGSRSGNGGGGGGGGGGDQGGGGNTAHYTADFNQQGNASLLRLQFGSALNVNDNTTSCPELGPGNFSCFDTANSVDVSSANLVNGVSVYGVYINQNDDTSVIYVQLSGNSGNGINDLGGSITFKSGFAGEGTDTTFTIAAAGQGGGGNSAVYIAENNDHNNGDSTIMLTMPADLNLNDGTSDCGPSKCVPTNSVTVTGIAGGAAISQVVLSPGDDDAQVIISFDSPNALTDYESSTVTYKAGTGGVSEDVVFDTLTENGGGGGGDNEDRTCTVSSSAPFQYSLGGAAVFDFVEAPFIERASPGFNAVVPTNIAAISAQFSAPIDPTTITTDNVTLHNVTADSNVSGTVSYHAGSQMVVFAPDANLASNSEFELRFDAQNVVSDLEIPVNQGTKAEFRTNSSSDSTDPTVFYTSAQGSGVPTTGDIVIQFSETMDVSTLTSSNITSSPGIVGTFEYDIEANNSLRWIPNQELIPSQSYTISLSSSVTDIAGNSIDTSHDEFTFTTGTADNTTPDVNWVEAKETWIRIGLNTAPNKSTITGDAKDNIEMECNNVPVSTSFADVILEPGDIIRIDNLQLTAGQNCGLNFGSQAKARNGSGLTMNSDFQFGVESDFGGYGTTQFISDGFVDGDFINPEDFDFADDWGQFDSDTYTHRADDPFFAAISPIIIEPFNKRAGATTDVFVEFPVTRQVEHGDKIVLKGFTLGTNLTNASMATDNINDNIINGGAVLSNTDYNDAVVTISSVDYNPAIGGLELTVAIDVDDDGSADAGAETYAAVTFKFLLSGIVNSQNATNNDFTEADAFADHDRPEIEIKSAQGQLIEEVGKAEPIFVEAAGPNTITGQARTIANAAIQDAFCELRSFSGREIKKTDESGNCSFTNLPDGDYTLTMNAAYGYIDVFTGGKNISVSGGATQTETQKYAQAEHQLSGTISHSAFDKNTKIDIIVAGDKGVTVCQVTATASQTSTAYTCRGSEGSNFVTLEPGFNREALFVDVMDNPFNPPRGQQINMDGNETLNWSGITAPSATIQGKVVDENGEGIANVRVFAFERGGLNQLSGNDLGFGGAETQTTSDGTFVLKVDDNRTYNVSLEAYNKYKEKPITIINGTQSVAENQFRFQMNKPAQSIKGSCLFNDKPIPCEINARSDDGSSTRDYSDNEDGYTLFVDDGEWTLDALSWDKGYLGQISVTVDGDNHTGQNFSVSASDVKTVEGTVQVGGAALANANVWVERYNTTSGLPLDGRSKVTNADGAFSVDISALSSGQAYRAFIDHPEYGGFPPQNNLTDSDTGSNSINLGSMNTVTFVTSGADALGINHGFLNMFEETNDTFADIPIEKSGGTLDGSYTLQVPNGTYHVVAFMDRFGEIEPDEGGEIEITGNTTLNFTGFGSKSFIDVTVTVQDSSDDALQGAEVAMFGDGKFASGTTDSDGQVTLSLPEPSAGKSYKVGARLGGYMSPSPVSVNTTISRTLTLKSAGSTISGTVSTANGTAGDAFVYAECSDGSRSETFSEDTGLYSIPVPSGTTCTVNVTTPTGFTGSSTGVSAGASAENITASGTIAYAKHFETKKTTMDLATGGTVSVSDDDAAFDEVKLKIPTGALASSSANGSVTGKAAAPPVTDTAQPLAAIDLTASNSSTGAAITSATKDMTLTTSLDKANIDALVSDRVMTVDDIPDIQNSYYDSSSGYSTLATTMTCKTQNESGDNFVQTDCDTLATNVEGDSSFYNDYKITMTSTVDHFTVFAPVIGSGEGGGGGKQRGVFGYVEGIASSDSPGTQGEEGTGDTIEEVVEDAVEAAEDAEEGTSESTYVVVDEESGTVTQLVPPAGTFAVELFDIQDHWAFEPINELASRGILSGYGNGDFRPDQSMTRAELVKVAVRAMELPVPIEVDARDLEFADITDEDWFLPYVYAAVQEGLVEGRIRFRPHDLVNRAEALKILLLASGANLDQIPSGFVLPFADVARDAWYRPHVKYAYFLGVVGGYLDDGMRYFEGGENITRAEVSKLVTELFDFDMAEAEVAEEEEDTSA